MPITVSPLAQLGPALRNVTNRAAIIPWGACVHTTGSGVTTEAARLGISPLETAIAIYSKPDAPPVFTNFPHYVIDSAGTIVQLADERERARHVRISDDERADYLHGTWRMRVSAAGLDAWDRKWGAMGKRNPLQLFPSRHPNEDYLGIELLPSSGQAPLGSSFTVEQYDRLAELLEDIESRYRIELEGSRLVGHEDISPLTRWNAAGGWDPGALRERPLFLWHQLQRRDGSALG